MNTKTIQKILATTASAVLLLSLSPLSAFAAVPSISSISPASVTVGSSAITLTVNGANFDGSSVVYFNGNARSTSFVSSNQVTANIPASDLNTVGAFNVSVQNPGSGGGTSNTVSFTVGNSSPSISGISPSSVLAGSSAFTLTVNGSGFTPNSMVNFNGSGRSTTYHSPTQVTATINTLDVANVASNVITVTNPGPGGGTSNGAMLSVVSSNSNPVPVMTNMSPTSMVVGSGAFTLSVYGSNFIPGSYVRYNGLTRATTYVSSGQLNAVIPASDVNLTGLYLVDVVNPSPVGGASNGMLFTVTPLTGTTPTLPNTGFGPNATTSPLAAAVALMGVAAIIGLAVSARKAWEAAK